MTKVAVIGCGVVGAAIAYELSQIPELSITVFDARPPAQAATGAALGVLMGFISQKMKGRAWQMRLASMQRYETLIPELEAIAGQPIPFNRQGILRLCFADEDLAKWETLATTRQAQGWQLDILERDRLQADYPYLNTEAISAAIYSPQDRQVDPVALTLALVKAAEHNGVAFEFGTSLQGFEQTNLSSQALGEKESDRLIKHLHTSTGSHKTDWVVLAAGLGSTPLTQSLAQPIEIRPVLGQALQLQLPHPIGDPAHEPVITGNDVHLVPLGAGNYWVGATVEFLPEEISGNGLDISPPLEASHLQAVLDQAIAFCPVLADAKIIRTWSGLRPRPVNRPAPVIGKLPGYCNVLLATGHYRNGVLLAPATAQIIRDAILGVKSDWTGQLIN